ncbi:MAG: DUF4430 domain-containing protein [Clostridia bacterium]|nr:DUF4430 domain-containing protein [Clostridia bacterium]
MKSKALCLLLAIMLTFLLTGCRNTQNSTTSLVNEKVSEKRETISEVEKTQEKDSLPKKASEKKEIQHEVKSEAESVVQKNTEETVLELVQAEKPADKVETVEEKTSETVEKTTCFLSVRCDTILSNIDKLKKGKESFVPSNGIIFAEKEVVFFEGESVFDVLLREMRNSNIHMEFNETPMYKTAYIEGINNLYEFDCGELSGWTYKVNGKSISTGCSKYIVGKGDYIEWVYTCNMGKDI